MRWFGKDKTETLPAPAEKSPGFFALDWLKNSGKKTTPANMLMHSFQRGIESLKVVNASGMDSADDAKVSKFATDNNDLTVNRLTATRTYGLPEPLLNWFAGQGFIGYQMCAVLSQNWLIDKACSMPAKDASRSGYEITVNDGTEVKPEILEFMRQKDKEFGVIKNCADFVRGGRIFGIRVAMFIIDPMDPDYYAKPFNPDGVKPGSYRGISQIDPYWMAPELDAAAAANPASIHFYEPTWWRISGMRVHRSHLVIMRTCDVPDILKPSYFYGGIPLTQRIAERVYAAERTANEAPMLTMSKRLLTYKADLTQAASNPEDFQTRLQVWTDFMNNFGVKVIGGDEEVQQFDTSLSDLDEVIMTQFQLVAAASGVPATKLLGTSPKGFNATGEFEEASYHEELETIQHHDLTPLVERHHLLLIRSLVAPKFGIKPFSTEVNWKPVDSPTAAELADLNLKKAQTDTAYVNAGAIDGEDVRNRLIGDKDSGYNGLEAGEAPGIEEEGGEELITADSYLQGEISGGSQASVKSSKIKEQK